MANMSNDELQPVNSWLEAVQNSKGYEDKPLLLNLIEQFKANLCNRLPSNPITNLSQRQIHLLLAFFKIGPAQGGGVVSIADFGGGNGYMCDFLRVNNPDIKIIYDVYETTEVAKGYNKFGKELEINFLDIKTFGKKKYDLVIISCTLQYIENWKEVLTTSSRIAENILLMRLPLTDANKHNFFIQHNYAGVYSLSKSSWPITLFSKNLFLKEIQKIFNIVFELTDTEENYIFKDKTFYVNSLLLKTKESY